MSGSICNNCLTLPETGSAVMFFIFRKGKIHYTDSGNGQVIVLLHGYLESSAIWDGFGKRLASEFRVIAVDLPGHGLSDIYEETHTMEFIATAVKELIDSLDLKKVVLAGHSLGGYVALAFLELYPDYLSGYSLFHSHPFSDSKEAVEKRLLEIEIVKTGKKELMYPENITRMFAPSNLERLPGALSRSKEIAAVIPGEGIIAVLKGMILRPSRVSVMEEGRIPCLWVLGLMDLYIPCDVIQLKVNLPSNARVVVLKESGHLGFIEEEERSIEVIRDFVKGV